MGDIKTFQTVKLPLDVWQLVAEVMRTEDLDFSHALERLVRHGYIRLTTMREQEQAVIG